MPVFNRVTQGWRSDGRGNYRYIEAAEADVIRALQEYGWVQTSDGSIQPPLSEAITEEHRAPQHTNVVVAARSIIQEQRPFCTFNVRNELTDVCEQGLLAGTVYRTASATYTPMSHVVDVAAGPVTRFVVERRPINGTRLPDYDCLDLDPSGYFQPVGDPELERLLREEEAIEASVREHQALQEETRPRREAIDREERLSAMQEALMRSATVTAHAPTPRPARVRDEFINPAPVAATAPNQWPGYDGRLP